MAGKQVWDDEGGQRCFVATASGGSPELSDGEDLAVLTGADLAAWRVRFGYTQEVAADVLGVAQGTISKAERCRSRVLGGVLQRALEDTMGGSATQEHSLCDWPVELGQEQDRGQLVELVPASAPCPGPARYRVRIDDVEIEVDDHFREETLKRLLNVVAGC